MWITYLGLMGYMQVCVWDWIRTCPPPKEKQTVFTTRPCT